MPLRADVHGNWVAQQSGNGDEMDDGAQNKGGAGSSAWAGFDSSRLVFCFYKSKQPKGKKKNQKRREQTLDFCSVMFLMAVILDDVGVS